MKFKTSSEALNELYIKYMLPEGKYYSLVSENENEYIFEVLNSNDGKKYIVLKETGEILISYQMK